MYKRWREGKSLGRDLLGRRGDWGGGGGEDPKGPGTRGRGEGGDWDREMDVGGRNEALLVTE